MKLGLFAVILALIAGCAPSQSYRSTPGPYGGGSRNAGGGSGMSSDMRPTSSLSQDATECERKAILAGPGGKAAAFDSCMRAKGHGTSR